MLWLVTSYAADCLVAADATRRMEAVPDLQSACGQLEVCPTTGRRHAQMALRLNRSVGWSEAVAMLPPLFGNANVQMAKDVEGVGQSWPRLVQYCTKVATRAVEGWQLRWWGESAEAPELPAYSVVVGRDRFVGWTRASGAMPERASGTDAGEEPRGGHRARGGGGGSKTDDVLMEALDCLKAGEDCLDICVKLHCLSKLPLVEKMAASWAKRPRLEERDVEIEYLWGVTGAGKSTHAMRTYPAAYWKRANTEKWWCGYAGQKVLVLDDIRAREFVGTDLLRILDPFPFPVEVKGGVQWAVWNRVVITSNEAPSEFVGAFHPDIQEPLRRRIFGDKCKIKFYAERWTAAPPPAAQPVDESETISISDTDGEGDGAMLWDARGEIARFAAGADA